MTKNTSKKTREIKEPTKGMLDFYSNLFKRNQSKWIRRSKLEPTHLGVEFEFNGEQAKIIGSMNSEEVVLQLTESNRYLVTHIDGVTQEILGE